MFLRLLPLFTRRLSAVVSNFTYNTDRIFMKILPETKKSPLNFGSRPDLDPDLGIF